MDWVEFTNKFIKCHNSAIKKENLDLIKKSSNIFSNDDLNKLNMIVLSFNSCNDKMYKMTFDMQIQELIKHKISDMKLFIDIAEDLDDDFGSGNFNEMDLV
jgi:hypothetical protein